MVGMREYVWNRLEGRPFVAVNQEATTKVNTLKQDQRLQLAIQNLIIGDKKTHGSSAVQQQKALPSETLTLP
jgi:hypothetical protein